MSPLARSDDLSRLDTGFAAAVDQATRRSLMAAARRQLRPDDAAEAVAEAIARGWASRATYYPDAPVAAWLHGILRNVIREHHRRRATLAGLTVGPDGPRGGDDVSDAVCRRDDVAAVRAAVAALPGGHRRLIELRFYDGLSSALTGTVLGLRAPAVRMAQTRALRQLRAALVTAGVLGAP